jgi:predicted  nucleic acid-binding Zn-ribbon protein
MKMQCPHCGVRGTVPDSLIGKRAKCPKCGDIFTATAEEAPVALGDEPTRESTISPSTQTIETGDSPGMTAQDEANLEEELAKIFDEMKQSSAEEEEEPVGTAAEDDIYADIDTGPLSVSQLQEQLEDLMDERCAVCGTIVGKANKLELNGVVYCSKCLPGIDDAVEDGKHLAVTEKAEQEKESGALRKLGTVVAGLVIIGIFIAAVYYIAIM